MRISFHILGRYISNYPKIVTGISGSLAGLVFSSGMPALLLILFLLPLFHYFSSAKRLTAKRSILIIFSFFIPFHLIVLSWFLDSDTGALVGLSREMALFASVISLMIMTAVLTITQIPLALGLRRMHVLLRESPILSVFLVGSMWVISEWARSIGFSLFLYGSGGSIGDYWNFGSFGLALMDTPLAYISRVAGMYGLSFLVVAVAGITYYSYTKKRYAFMVICVTALFVVSLVSHRLYGGQEEPSLQGSVFQIKSSSSDFRLGAPIENYSGSKKDLVVLTEYSKTFEHGYELFAEEYVNKRLGQNGFSVDVSEGSKDKWYGTLEFRDNTGSLVGELTKQLLIPTGEYLPAVLTTFYNNTGQSKIVRQYDASRRVEKGAPPEVFSGKDVMVGPVACSGILGRNIYRQLTNDGAEVLTNSASLAYFNSSKSYYRQAMQMARFHAIANNRPFIQATMGAPAFVLDSNGLFVVEPADLRTTFIDFEFQPSSSKTPYTITGEWVLVFSGLAVVGTLFWHLKTKIFSRKA